MPGPALGKLRDALSAARSDPKIVQLYRKNLRMVMDTRSPQELETYMQELEKNYIALIKKFDKGKKK